jgi:chaperonin GroEL
MVWRPEVQKKLVFILMPFRQPFDGYYEHIIKPTAKSAGLDVLRADEIYGTRPIIDDIWRAIWRADIVVADVTDKNPNVNYELGLCHALAVPTILIAKRIDDIPFDYRHRRCITYNTDEAKWEERLSKALTNTFSAVLAEGSVEDALHWPYDTSLLKFVGSTTTPLSVEMPRQFVIRATAELAKSISRAYGPRGTNVWIKLPQRGLVSSKKGLVIADATRSPNSIEESGIEHMRKVARTMQDRIGDGTKTAMLMAESLIRHGQSAIDRGQDSSEVIKGLQKAVDVTLASIRDASKPVSTESLFQIARTASGREDTAQLVANAMKAAGKDGVVTIERSTGAATNFTIQDGLRFDRGYLSQEFVTDPKNDECVLEDCSILVCDRKLSFMREMLPLLEQLARSQRPLLIIAENVEGEALSTLTVNKLRGVLSCAAVGAPAHGDRRIAILRDVATLAGAKMFGSESALRVEAAKLDDLGRAKRIVISKGTTTILGGHGMEATVRSHVENLRAAIDRSRDPYERERLQERLTNLAGSVVTIMIGGATDLDIEDQGYRVESALHTANASVRGGYVPGGGAALLKCSQLLRSLQGVNQAQKAGIDAVANAFMQPFLSLIESCGRSAPDFIAEQSTLANDAIGFNVETESLENMHMSGIIDATNTITAAVQAASSFARVILQTDVWNVNEAEQL